MFCIEVEARLLTFLHFPNLPYNRPAVRRTVSSACRGYPAAPPPGAPWPCIPRTWAVMNMIFMMINVY